MNKQDVIFPHNPYRSIFSDVNGGEMEDNGIKSVFSR